MSVLSSPVFRVLLARLGHRTVPARAGHRPHVRAHQRHREQMQQDGQGGHPDGRATGTVHEVGKLQRKRKAPEPEVAGASEVYLAAALALLPLAGFSCSASPRRVIQVGA